MQTWYYSSNGERQGPVSFEELQALARRGGLDPVKDLAWTEGMSDWKPAGQVTGLFQDAPANSAAFNPYAAPGTASHDLLAPLPAGNLSEIPPGSYPLDIMGTLGRAIEITKRHFAPILGIGLVYIIASAVMQYVCGRIDAALGWGSFGLFPGGIGAGSPYAKPQLSVPIFLIGSAFSTLLYLGLARTALNFVSGSPASVGTLFSQGDKLLRALGASLLYMLAVLVGILLLIVPGIYIAIRLSMYHYAIIDRRLGVMDSLRYSWAATHNNALSLFGLGIMCLLIMLAGALAVLLGLVFAIPVVTLASALAYRCFQFGPAALADYPGTKTPVLQGHPGS